MTELSFTAGEVARAAGGRVAQGDSGRVIDRVSIDSRTIAPGDFFIALRGERFDGHRFAPDALAKGASGVLVEPGALDPASVPAGAVAIEVADTTRALQDIARTVRDRSGARVVAITGSAGKTTTKEITAEFLAARYRVYRNRGNLNNHIGLPLSLLDLRTGPEIAVVELGMNHPGEIRTLVGIARPDVRVWTNVGDAHLGFFPTTDAIAEAKAEILEQAGAADVLVANADDARVMAHARRFAGRVVTFGLSDPADVHARDVQLRGLDGSACTVRTRSAEATLSTPLLGMGNLANVLAAVAVAAWFDVPLAACAARAASLRPAHHRGELVRLPGGVTLIDDSYNSSPSALKRSLETVKTATGSARKGAVLGEMLELGEHAAALHEECGRAAAASGLDFLITVGGAPAHLLADAAVGAGMKPACVRHVATRGEAGDVALEKVRPGDLVLIKGSRGIGTDAVVERLKAEFA